MAAYAALVSLFNTTDQIQSHPRLSTSLDNLPIQPLLEKTGSLLHFIERNNHSGGSEEIKDLERKIASAANGALDLIDSHIVDQIHEESDGSEISLDLQQINEEMDAIIKEANEFKERHAPGLEQPPTHQAGPLMQSGESAMVGLDAELKKLLDELTGDQPSRRIISTVGMGGTGKTTLAKNIYECKLIKELFQLRAWATISQQNNAQEVLSQLLFSLGESSNGTVDDLGLQLHKTLSSRKYLIVLDDIWSVTAWDEVKRFFPDYQNQSRILLTTRLSNVAKDCGSSLFMISLLDDVNSWKLFCEKVFQHKDCPSELREVGEEIVRSCKGLALSIVVIGGLLLKSPRTLEYWKSVVEYLKLIPDSKEKQESLDLLSLSYNHLPPHLKPCFLYMGVFKEDSKIHVTKIVELWVAEGFIKPIRSQVLEEVAEGFIKDLIDRNLILGYKGYENEEIGFCGIHDLLRELCIKLAEQEGFFQVFDDTTRGIVHRVVEGTHLGRAKVRIPRLGSIMTLGRIKDPTKYKLLRVLDETTPRSEVVDYYGNVNLRYLAYQTLTSWAHVERKLPTSFSNLWNLQSLYILTSYFIVAPTEFWKMQQLRHVNCRRFYVPSPPLSNVRDGSLMLDNLQTFKAIVNLRLCEDVCKIISNVKELHLNYSKFFNGYDDSFIEYLCNLDRLHKLDSLVLHGTSQALLLDRELRTTSFPISLKKLTLASFKLKWDDMIIIGSLPQLEALELRSILVFCGERCWSPVDGQFHRLKFLEIDGCELDRWVAEESHFPVLERLILVELYRLEEIPLCIGDIPTLELIHVNKCSLSAAISALRIKEDQLEYDDQLQVQVTVRKTDMESFKQMSETKELSMDNIEFKISQI